MRNKQNASDYFLFFATNHPLGLVKMKEAMWRVDPQGTYQFSDATDRGQTVMFGPEVTFADLRWQIVRRFAGQSLPVEELERIVSEETAFLPSHDKRILRELECERPPKLEVESAKDGRRRATFPPGTRLRFL
jgi:hypothetical protein